MSLRPFAVSLLIAALALPAAACDDATPTAPVLGAQVKGEGGKTDSSVEAVFVDMSFEGELLATSCWGLESKIEDQLLFTIGQLNGDKSVGRLDRLELDAIESDAAASGGCEVHYKARIPVAWGKRNHVPDTYTFLLPRDVSYDGLSRFTESYKHDCVEYGAHDVSSGSIWYYYRPTLSRCELADADIFEAKAEVSLSPINTTGKYPEYHKVWEDGVLQVVAVFGKYEDGATSASDAGIAGYNSFIAEVRDELGDLEGYKTTPAEIPDAPGVEVDDIVFTAQLDATHAVQVVALLVDNVRTAGPEFGARYEALSGTADLIVYNGHAGLGSNVRALASKGSWLPDQYVIVFMNGCDSFAYIDSALAEAHQRVNDDDPEGTKYLDIITNARPSFFRSMPAATMALIGGLMAWEEPRTYEQMFKDVDRSQVILVSGEQDNVYVPGYDPDATTPTPDAWAGLSEEGSVTAGEELRYETPTLVAGRYLFALSGDGDADLYVRVGEAPTTALYDCRPYHANSEEICEVDLPSPSVIHVMVRGWAASSQFSLSGQPQGAQE